MEIRKLLYSMGEVSEMFDVNPSLIRYWETQFDVLKPKKNKKGNRLFTPEDVRTLKVIYHLVKERGMTLEGAKKCLKQNRGAAERDSELLERLQRIRSLLVEVREDLKAGADELLVDDAQGNAPENTPAEPSYVAAEPNPAESAAAEPTAAESAIEKKPRPRRRRAEVPEPEFEVAANSPNEEPNAEDPRTEETRTDEPQLRSRRRRGRTGADAQEKELFAFYEQTLFNNHED